MRKRRLGIEPLELRRLLSVTPIISEFMASNSTTLTDYYGKNPDWLEIYNPETSAVTLSGWKLVDNSTSWSIPANVSIAAQGYLVVFCDGRDAVAPNGELHSNFKLGASGDYLALEQPDNTVVSAYSPQYPPQVPDVSYGVSTSLVGTGSVATALVPTTGNGDTLGTTWQGNPANEPFDDDDWSSGTIGAGYGDTVPDGSATLHVRLNADTASAMTTDSNTTSSVHTVTNVGSTVSWVSSVTDTSASPMLRRGVMQFNAASNSQMTVNPSSDLYNSTTGTISFWMNSTGTTGTGSDGAVLFDMRSTRGLMILQTDAGNIRVRAYRQSDGAVVNEIVSNAQVSDGQWHLITVNFSQALNSTCSLYIDGVLDKSGTNTSAWNWTTTETLKLGRSTGTNALPYKSYNGLMDDFRFYTAQLTPAQISDMANGLDGGVTTSDVGLNVQGDMQNVNTSAFIRVPFDVTVPSSISTLTLTMRFTDGFVAWINGQQVAAVNAPASPAWNSAATAAHSPERYYSVTFAATSGLLQAGTNILAIQGMDVSASEANFLILPQLNSDTIASGSGVYFATPTPGAANSAGKTNLGPYVSDVTDDVAPPAGGSSSAPLTIQATVGASLHALSTVQIAYRIMFGSETLATMYDDGTHGDPTAGDGIYTAQIPTTALTAGQMLRLAAVDRHRHDRRKNHGTGL